MKQVYFSSMINGKCYHPLLKLELQPNEARETAILMKSLRPDWEFRVKSEYDNEQGWDFIA